LDGGSVEDIDSIMLDSASSSSLFSRRAMITSSESLVGQVWRTLISQRAPPTARALAQALDIERENVDFIGGAGRDRTAE
jgi:hypothetical protein